MNQHQFHSQKDIQTVRAKSPLLIEDQRGSAKNFKAGLNTLYANLFHILTTLASD